MSRYFGVVLWLVGFFGMFLMVVQPAWGYTVYFVNAVVWFLLLVIVPVEVNLFYDLVSFVFLAGTIVNLFFNPVSGFLLALGAGVQFMLSAAFMMAKGA